MKKFVILSIIVLLAFPTFADMQLELGPVVMLDFPIPLKELGNTDAAKSLGLEDLVFGADIELIWGLLQFGALATVNLPVEEEREDVLVKSPLMINLGLDAGVLLDLLLVRVGIGAGPTFRIAVDEEIEEPLDLGINVKGNVDLSLGGIALRLNIATFLDILQMTKEEEGGLATLPVNVGLSLLLAL